MMLGDSVCMVLGDSMVVLRRSQWDEQYEEVDANAHG